jgi:hypothetical protein
MEATATIASATFEDEPEIAQISRQVTWRTPWHQLVDAAVDPDGYARWMSEILLATLQHEDWFFLTAKCQGKVVGYLQAWIQRPYALSPFQCGTVYCMQFMGELPGRNIETWRTLHDQIERLIEDAEGDFHEVTCKHDAIWEFSP